MDYGPHPSPVSFVVLPASLSRNARNSIVSASIFLPLSPTNGFSYGQRKRDKLIIQSNLLPLSKFSRKDTAGDYEFQISLAIGDA